MENTQICEQIIKDFNGTKIQGKIFSSEGYKCVYKKKPTRKGNLGKQPLEKVDVISPFVTYL